MTNEDEIRQILFQYKKFGWQLERVILSADLRDKLGESFQVLFENKPIAESDLDAMWFSRRAVNRRIALELRSLGPSPFALVDSVGPDASETELNELFDRVEDRMRQRLIRPSRDH